MKRTRLLDWVLIGGSIVLGALAGVYRVTWLAWISAAAFWLAVFLSARRQPGSSKLVARVAAGVLLAVAVIIVIALVLTLKPPVASHEPKSLQMTAPVPGPPR